MTSWQLSDGCLTTAWQLLESIAIMKHMHKYFISKKVTLINKSLFLNKGNPSKTMLQRRFLKKQYEILFCPVFLKCMRGPLLQFFLTPDVIFVVYDHFMCKVFLEGRRVEELRQKVAAEAGIFFNKLWCPRAACTI